MKWSEDTVTHLKEHIAYPVTGPEVLEVCRKMIDIKEDEKTRVEQKIDPEITYESGKQVVNAPNKT